MNIPVQNCSSCGACSNICARSAISMQLDGDGFYRPVIDINKCVRCGICERICPWIQSVENPNQANASPKTVAAYAKDETIRIESSSGGIFTVLAEKVLDVGGVVVGVAQITPTRFAHIIVKDKVELAKLRGSKYVQAYAGTIYRDVRTLLKAGKKVLFSGTPCQVAALYAVLGKASASANLITVDIVCHGSPSVKVFEKYVAEIEKSKSAQVLSTRFRDKRKGWRLYSVTSSLNTISGNFIHFSKNLHEDKFMRVFLQNICLNTSCAVCKYGKLPRIADITLGDFWNIAVVHPEMDDDKGTSLILLNTKPGKILFNLIADRLIQRESNIKYAIAGNRSITYSSKEHFKRADFFANLDKYNFNELIQRYCPFPSPLKRLYYQIRRNLGRIKRIKNHLF